jgi:hypothetical protein
VGFFDPGREEAARQFVPLAVIADAFAADAPPAACDDGASAILEVGPLFALHSYHSDAVYIIYNRK